MGDGLGERLILEKMVLGTLLQLVLSLLGGKILLK